MPGLLDISKYLHSLVDNLQGFWAFLTTENIYDSIGLFIDGLADGNILEIILGAALSGLLAFINVVFYFFNIPIESVSLLDLLLGSVFTLFVVYQLVKWFIPS